MAEKSFKHLILGGGGAAIRSRVRKVPLAFYNVTPNALFSDSDFSGWSFKFNVEESIPVNAMAEQDVPPVKRQRVQ